jgi:hypothetical protein
MNSVSLPISQVNTTVKSSHVIQYTLDDFNKIIKEGFMYKLPDEVIAIIQSIAEKVGAPEYIKTPLFEKSSSSSSNFTPHNNNNNNNNINYHNNNHNNHNNKSGFNNNKTNNKVKSYEIIKDDDWEKLRKFQATVILKKEGINASIDQLRKHLNKITTKTYDNLKEQIIKEINLISQNLDSEMPEMLDEVNKIGDAIFSIASSNGFYSAMYAKLYKELMELYPFMQSIFEHNFNKFRDIFNKIEYCDPNTDYDTFCKNNKTNEKRRSLGLFYMHLMDLNVVKEEKIITIISELQSYIISSINTAGYKPIVDELSEILFILITSDASKKLLLLDKWDHIFTTVKEISKLKPSDYESITNKTIYKHMDIIDKLNNR